MRERKSLPGPPCSPTVQVIGEHVSAGKPRDCAPLVGRSNLSPLPPLVTYHLDDKAVNGKQSDCGTENN